MANGGLEVLFIAHSAADGERRRRTICEAICEAGFAPTHWKGDPPIEKFDPAEFLNWGRDPSPDDRVGAPSVARGPRNERAASAFKRKGGLGLTRSSPSISRRSTSGTCFHGEMRSQTPSNRFTAPSIWLRQPGSTARCSLRLDWTQRGIFVSAPAAWDCEATSATTLCPRLGFRDLRTGGCCVTSSIQSSGLPRRRRSAGGVDGGDGGLGRYRDAVARLHAAGR